MDDFSWVWLSVTAFASCCCGFALGYWARRDDERRERDMTMAELRDYRAKASRVSVRQAKRETAGTMFRRLN